MSDLISRQAVLTTQFGNVESRMIDGELYYSAKDIKNFINSIPTTYAVDKVVEQLEAAIKDTTDKETGIAARWAYKGAIEIVKAGGVNE